MNKIVKFSILDEKKQNSHFLDKMWTKIRNLDEILDDIGDCG